MHVLIDASSLMKELTGIGVYTRNLLNYMIPAAPEIQFTIFMNALKGPTPAIAWAKFDNVRIVRRRIPGKILLECWRREYPPSIEFLSGIRDSDVFHSPNFLYQKSKSARIIATVHDLAFMKQLDYGSRYSGQYHRITLKKNIRKADHIIVVTNAVKEDLIQVYRVDPQRISVIHHGLDPQYKPSEDVEHLCHTLRSNKIPDNYVLSVGTLEARKNFPFLIRAFSKISTQFPDLHLILAGRPADALQDIEDTISECGIRDRVILTGYIELAQLISLYQGARIAVFPSWDEGFGFPPLEAAACSTPVLASNIAAHHEVLEESAWYFSPTQPDELESLLLKLLSDSNLIQERSQIGIDRAREFSWQEAAKSHIAIYKKEFLS